MALISPPSTPTEKVSSRDRILQAGKALFSSRGYESTSTVMIARAAGTSESQLMKHFGSKEGLLEAIFESAWDQMGITFRAIHDLRSGSDKLHALLELVMKALDRDLELKELLLLEGRRIRKEGHMVMMTKGYREFIRVIDAILLEMRANRELDPALHLEAARAALTGMFEAMLRDQVLATRMDYPAHYGPDDVRRIFTLVVTAFAPSKSR